VAESFEHDIERSGFKMDGKFLTSRENICFLRRTLLHGVDYWSIPLYSLSLKVAAVRSIMGVGLRDDKVLWCPFVFLNISYAY
jgi:hypothetical protein